MSVNLDSFLARVPDFSSMPSGAQNELLLYHLQSDGELSASVAEIDALRLQLKLPKSGTAGQFSAGSHSGRGRRPRFVKAKKGYSLERAVFEELHKKYGQRPTAAAIKSDLAKHLAKLTDADLKEYLRFIREVPAWT